MPGISASPSNTVATRTLVQMEKNTHDLEAWTKLLLSELRRLRLGDTSEGDEELVK